MVKAIKCTKCGLHYNAAIYNTCPHCQSAEPKTKKEEIKGETHEEVKKEIKGGLGSFIFGGKREDISRKTENYFEIKQEKITETVNSEEVLKPDREHDIVKQIEENKETKKNEIPTPEPKGASLKNEISKVGRTVGKYISSSSEDVIEPVVGWLICVKGTYFGQSFQLKTGKNKIGRGKEFDVKLLNDDSISRTCMAVIAYDGKAREFSVWAGESDKLSYLNGKALYERVVLNGYEEIEFGDSEKNKFIFVPLCGEKFAWENYDNGIKRD